MVLVVTANQPGGERVGNAAAGFAIRAFATGSHVGVA